MGKGILKAAGDYSVPGYPPHNLQGRTPAQTIGPEHLPSARHSSSTGNTAGNQNALVPPLTELNIQQESEMNLAL